MYVGDACLNLCAAYELDGRFGRMDCMRMFNDTLTCSSMCSPFPTLFRIIRDLLRYVWTYSANFEDSLEQTGY